MVRHTATVENIKPDEAAAICEHQLFVGQRKEAVKHISFLAEVMQRGEFDGGEPIRFAVLKGKHMLINGRHRLEAIAQSGLSQTLVVVTSHCSTAEEVAKLYARIDRGRGRNMVDALNALGVSDRTGLTGKQLATVMSCAPIYAEDLRSVSVTGSHYNSKSAEGRMAVMEPWMDAAKAYFAAVHDAAFGNSREFFRRDVAAVGIATFGDRPAVDYAEAFWAGMANDDGLAASDPRKRALEHIKRYKSSTGRTATGLGYVAHGVVTCWNAWVRGDDLKIVKVPDERGPLKIAGTRFAKRQDDGSLDIRQSQAATLPMVHPFARKRASA